MPSDYDQMKVLKFMENTKMSQWEREREHICLHFWPFSSGFIQWVKVWRELLLTSICAFWAWSINVFCTESSLILISKGLRVTYFSVIFISPLPTYTYYRDNFFTLILKYPLPDPWKNYLDNLEDFYPIGFFFVKVKVSRISLQRFHITYK